MTPEKFLNPYTFVPVFPRGRLPGELQDDSPPSRDRLHAGRWTGRIDVTLTTETPLVLHDTARATEDKTGHRTYPVRLRDGRPHLASTAVKGMLRSAYETITNSRYGVFHGHDAPLGFRHNSGYALTLKPVRVAADGLLEEQETALLEMYEKDGTLRNELQASHMEQVTAVIKLTGKYGRPEVTRLIRHGDAETSTAGGELIVTGIAYVTGPNVDLKRFERLFFVNPRKRAGRLPLVRPWEEIRADWDRLIANYIETHKEEEELHGRSDGDGGVAKPGERVGDGPGKHAWSPHIYDPNHQELTAGTLCYARMQGNKVDRLYPVLIPRDLYPVSPADLVDPCSLPAPSYCEMSPADRLFGWVAPAGKGVRPAGYRGRLRIGPVTCADDADTAVRAFSADGLPLAILSTPKPQQGRFYVAESVERPNMPIEDGTARVDIYQSGRGLRGRKAYWHHAGLDAEQHWEVPSGCDDPAQIPVGDSGRYREYLRPRPSSGDLAEQRDSQNRSIRGWVRPKTVFRFTVEVRDLEPWELGALAWLLTLPEGHFHRLGFGRPLGFGSVRLDIEHAELHTGTDYAAYYRSLDGTLPERDWHATVEAARNKFDALVDNSKELKIIRTTMLIAARGWSHLSVHYPRVRRNGMTPTPPDPDGRQYEWFTANEQMEKGEIAPGRGRSLPQPAAQKPYLPIYPAEQKNGHNGWGGRNR